MSLDLLAEALGIWVDGEVSSPGVTDRKSRRPIDRIIDKVIKGLAGVVNRKFVSKEQRKVSHCHHFDFGGQTLCMHRETPSLTKNTRRR